MPPKTRFLHMIVYKMVFVCPLKLDFCMEYNSYSPKKQFSHMYSLKNLISACSIIVIPLKNRFSHMYSLKNLISIHVKCSMYGHSVEC